MLGCVLPVSKRLIVLTENPLNSSSCSCVIFRFILASAIRFPIVFFFHWLKNSFIYLSLTELEERCIKDINDVRTSKIEVLEEEKVNMTDADRTDKAEEREICIL